MGTHYARGCGRFAIAEPGNRLCPRARQIRNHHAQRADQHQRRHAASGQHRIGVMDDATYRKITVRHLGEKASRLATPISAEALPACRA